MGAETASFIAGRVSLIAAVADADLRPRALRAWGLRVLSADDGLVRVVLDAVDAPSVEDAFHRGGRIAVTATDVPTLDARQVKGTIRAVAPGDDDDRELLERYCREVFADISHTDDIPMELLLRIKPDDLVACLFTVDEAYDQTPGPDAGAAVEDR